MEKSTQDLAERLYTLEAENTELRRKLSLYEESNSAIQEVKEVMRQILNDRGYSFFQNYVIGLDAISEFSKIENTIDELLKKRIELAKMLQNNFSLYEKYTTLYSLKEKLVTPEGKLSLLLQMIALDSEDNLLSIILEQDNKRILAEDVLDSYYKLLQELAGKAKSKNAVWDEFTLSVSNNEKPPTNEKERNKRQIRDNTIRNFYRRYGEKMFLPENMALLRTNLQKTGIKIDELSDVRIRNIVKRR